MESMKFDQKQPLIAHKPLVEDIRHFLCSRGVRNGVQNLFQIQRNCNIQLTNIMSVSYLSDYMVTSTPKKYLVPEISINHI